MPVTSGCHDGSTRSICRSHVTSAQPMWMSRISYGAGHDTRPQNLGTWLGPTMTTNSTQFPDSYF